MADEWPPARLSMTTDPTPALEIELRRAMLASDVAVLERLIDNALIFTLPNGTVAGKAADLEAHRTGQIRMMKLEPSDQRIARYGNTAVVSVQMEMSGTLDGVAFAGPFRYLRVWVERPDGWRIVAGHVSAVIG